VSLSAALHVSIKNRAKSTYKPPKKNPQKKNPRTSLKITPQNPQKTEKTKEKRQKT